MKPHKYQIGEEVVTDLGGKLKITRRNGWGYDKYGNLNDTPQYKALYIDGNFPGEWSYTEDFLHSIKKPRLTIKLNLYENKRSTISN